VRVVPITDDQAAVAEAVTRRMREAGIRAHSDTRSETLKYKIAEGVRMKVPYLAVIGKREAESDMVAINVRGAGREQKPAPLAVDAFIANVMAEVKSRSLKLEAGTA
jgi:threonyl-tRNA synthetase